VCARGSNWAGATGPSTSPLDGEHMDPFEARAKASAAVLLCGVWMLLAMLPLMIAGIIAMPPSSFWYLPAALLAYFVYTGIRAWRRGWKSRFILRIVIPILLLSLSAVLTGAWVWLTH